MIDGSLINIQCSQGDRSKSTDNKYTASCQRPRPTHSKQEEGRFNDATDGSLRVRPIPREKVEGAFNDTWREICGLDPGNCASPDLTQTEDNQFGRDQRADTSLNHYWELAESGSEKFTIEGELLFRKTPLNYDSLYVKQLIIPKHYRKKILRLSHDDIFSGHTSKNKCMACILHSMFWLGLSRDVTAWCRSCEDCQKQSTLKTADRAPFQPLPLIGEPMSDIECDVCGRRPSQKPIRETICAINMLHS